MCDNAILVYCLNGYKSQRMCNEDVDDCLAILKFIPDWFVTSKMLEKFHNVLLDNEEMLFLMKILIKSHFLPIKWTNIYNCCRS